MSSDYRSVLLSLEDRNEFGAKAAICTIYYDGSMEVRAFRYFLADGAGRYREPKYVILGPEMAHEIAAMAAECSRASAFLASVAAD